MQIYQFTVYLPTLRSDINIASDNYSILIDVPTAVLEYYTICSVVLHKPVLQYYITRTYNKTNNKNTPVILTAAFGLLLKMIVY